MVELGKRFDGERRLNFVMRGWISFELEKGGERERERELLMKNILGRHWI